jgi:hypothetical protein
MRREVANVSISSVTGSFAEAGGRDIDRRLYSDRLRELLLHFGQLLPALILLDLAEALLLTALLGHLVLDRLVAFGELHVLLHGLAQLGIFPVKAVSFLGRNV